MSTYIQEYYKCKKQYLALKGGQQLVYINLGQQSSRLLEVTNGIVVSEPKMNNDGIYITDRVRDYSEYQYRMVIIVASGKVDCMRCAIVCDSVDRVVEYFEQVDLKLGLGYFVECSDSGLFGMHKSLRSWELKCAVNADYVRLSTSQSVSGSCVLVNRIGLDIDGMRRGGGRDIVYKDGEQDIFYSGVDYDGDVLKCVVLVDEKREVQKLDVDEGVVDENIDFFIEMAKKNMQEVSGSQLGYGVFVISVVPEGGKILSVDVDLSEKYIDYEMRIVRRVFSKVKLLNMADMNDVMVGDLLELTSNKDIMTGIGQGELWDRKKIMGIVDDAKKDKGKIDKDRNYFDWVVSLFYGRGKIVGYVSLRPMFKGVKGHNVLKSDLQIRIFTWPGMGYGINIMKEIHNMAKKLGRRIWSVIHTDNKGSIAFFRKLGWTYKGEMRLGQGNNALFILE